MKILNLSLAILMLSSCTLFMDKSELGRSDAQKATSYFSAGDFEKAEKAVNSSLRDNPNQPQALLVSALVAEATARPNKARSDYEQLVLLNPQDTTVLTTSDMVPVKIGEVAKKRLRMLNIKGSEIIVEDFEGDKVFNISKDVASKQNKSALEQALFVKERQNINNSKAASEANVKAVEILFSQGEQNSISRFLILKELAESNLITKEEFLSARTANLGGILPLTNQAPAYGLDKPVPSADIIVERINVLKDGLEDRSVSSKEFLAERNAIVTALMPSNPRNRVAKKAPAKDILSAAKDLRKLEVLQELNLITAKEKEAEKKAIETHLGMNQQPKVIEKIVEVPVSAPEIAKPVVEQNNNKIKVEEIGESASNASKTPEVSSPF